MLNLIVRLYDAKKKQVKQTQFSKVRYFHLFIQQKNGLKRITDEIEEIPSILRSAADKRFFVESAVEYVATELNNQLELNRAKRKARAEAKTAKEKAENEKKALAKAKREQAKIAKIKKDFPLPEITNYEIPDRPSLNRLSAEVVKYVHDLVAKKVAGADIAWDRKRIVGFVKGLANYFQGKNIAIPTDRKFIDTLVIVNLGYTGGQGFDGIIEASKEEVDFFENLHEREITKNYFVDSEVTFQTKEIFRHNYIEDMLQYTAKSGNVLKYREQTILLQMSLKYDEVIRVDQWDIMNDSMGFDGPVSRIKADIRFLFQYALDRAIFNYTEKYVYSVRLITPLFARGAKLGERIDAKGEVSNGYGYSCARSPLQSHSDIDKIIESLFSNFRTDMLTYLARSNMESFAFEGLIIERLLNP